MKIEDNTIIFKSAPNNYFKEFMGVKPNTIRKFLDLKEFQDFKKFKGNLTPDSKIRILELNRCGDETGNFFERYITDISEFELLYIISWNPNEVKQNGKRSL